MTNYESQHNLDDELLSAYLDHELSPEERTAVEARLADDPVAQQLLHQLRSVSQSVQALPQEVVGHDLSDAVVRKVKQANRTATASTSDAGVLRLDSTNGAPPQRDDLVPTFTIGRSRRGWMWATLAVAAGLLIMVFQPDRNVNENLGKVAQRDDQPIRDQAAEETMRRRGGRGELELRPLSEPAATPATSELAELDAAVPAEPGGATRGFEASEAVSRPTPESGAASAGSLATNAATTIATAPPASSSLPAVELSTESRGYAESATIPSRRARAVDGDANPVDSPADAFAGVPSSVSLRRDRSELLGEVSGTRGQATVNGSDQVVVVRVLARNEALRNKSIDRLLASNGIQVAVTEASDGVVDLGKIPSQSRFADESKVDPNVELGDQVAQDVGIEQDLVLVQAPTTVIESCLESLNRDSENYLGLKVDNAATSVAGRDTETEAITADPTPAESAFAKKREAVSDWARYNRGSVPPQQEFFVRDKDANLNYRFNAPNEYYGRGGFGGGRYGLRGGLEQVAQDGTPQDEKSLGDETRGHARRLSLWGTVPGESDQLPALGGTAPEQQAATSSTARMREVQQQMKPPAQPSDETVQVLFVIQPGDEPAPSPPIQNKGQ